MGREQGVRDTGLLARLQKALAQLSGPNSPKASAIWRARFCHRRGIVCRREGEAGLLEQREGADGEG
jgi:hypothetical protein